MLVLLFEASISQESGPWLSHTSHFSLQIILLAQSIRVSARVACALGTLSRFSHPPPFPCLNNFRHNHSACLINARVSAHARRTFTMRMRLSEAVFDPFGGPFCARVCSLNVRVSAHAQRTFTMQMRPSESVFDVHTRTHTRTRTHARAHTHMTCKHAYAHTHTHTVFPRAQCVTWL